MPHFTVILTEPKYAGNVGAVARAMMNFDFKDLLIISQSFIITDECRKMAVHAQKILDNARIVDSFDEALKNVDYMVGTSSIDTKSEKKHLRRAVSLKKFAQQIYDIEGKVGISFGREDYGLLNEEIKKCDLLVKIPTSETYPSLNLSHAVSIVLYELYSSQRKDIEPRLAGRIEKETLYAHFDKLLDAINYPEHKKENTKILFRRIIGRAMLSKWEYHTLMGVLKKAITK
ncbi:MAG: RNA methyltransferase [Thermoplasmata archaeon]|nr:MAG: RNA methyltransferase [Thermoplasmata archaeon]